MDLNEMPKACKNNGVCNIIPSIPNGNILKGKYPALDSSTHLCTAGKCGWKWVQCEHLNVSRKLLPNLEN